MPYDLTTVLTTIAAASASIVAILGGFIASKLIAISSERSAVLERLRQINEELEFHITERDKIQAKNDESDALDFIQTAIDDLWAGNSLENVYSNVDHPDISIECLKPYWDRAVILNEQFQEQVKKKRQFNDDYIPTSLTPTVREDDFGYEVLRALGKKLKKRIRVAERAREKESNPFGLVAPDISDYGSIPLLFLAAASHITKIVNPFRKRILPLHYWSFRRSNAPSKFRHLRSPVV